MIFDPVYLLLMAPAFIFSLITSFWVKSAFKKYSKVATASGLTGAQAAARVLRSANVNNVQIEATRGFLSDHYDPSKKVLRLSPDAQGNSVASIGVAAQAEHAIRDAAGTRR
jgi:Zn-dependent membrane protease YugP